MAFNFLRKNNGDSNHVIRWAKTHDPGERADTPFIDAFFWLFIVHLLLYGGRTPHNAKSKWAGIWGLRNPYADDHGLLELACHQFVRLDYHLFAHHPDLREPIDDFLVEKLLGIFSSAVGPEQALAIFENRTAGYRTIIREGAAPSRGMEDHLIALMRIATRGEVVVEYDFAASPMANAGYDMFEHGEAAASVTAWFATSTPSFYGIVEELVRWAEQRSE